MEESAQTIIEQFVDYFVPELVPHESSLYLYLLRNSFLRNGTTEVRVGKRTIAARYGRGSRGESTNYVHVPKILQRFEQKGCIEVSDTNRLGTLYTVALPKDIPLVAEKIVGTLPQGSENNYFTNDNNRRELFEKDKWIC